MTLDSHHHFWRYTSAEYDWITDDMAVLRRDFAAQDLREACLESGVDGVISVQARQSEAETDFLLQNAVEHEWIRGVVGWAPLASPDVGERLDRWFASPQAKKLKGFRHVVQGEPDPRFLEGRAFNDGIAELTRRKLTYDLLVVQRQLPAALHFVDRHPSQRFVVDHIGKPVVSGRPDPEWVASIRALGEREHVWMKWSGVLTEAPGWSATPEVLRAYFEVVLEAFGSRRLLWGSDWPVLNVATPYGKWVRQVRALVSGLNREEQAAILGMNAQAFYRVDTKA